MATKKQILDTIKYSPVEIGHWVGFKDLTELHNEWLKDFLFRKDDQTKQGHRGSYKTTTLSLFFALHTIIQPNETIIYLRKTATDVNEIARQTINILSSGCIREIVRTLYGTEIFLTKATSNEISTNLATGVRGASQITGLGIGTSITGKHSDIVVTDDIVNLQDRISMAEREHTKIAYQELQNIKNRGGRFINTGTPWHKEDAFTLMPNIQKYDCYSTGLISDAELEEIKAKMLPSLFAANYELRHIASEDVIFTEPQTDADPSLAEQGLVHIDCAYDGEDYTALTICNRKDGKYYVYGRCWRKNCMDIEDEMIKCIESFNAGKIYNEDNADKGFFAKDMRKKGMRVSLYHEGMNKFVKITSYLKSEWKNVIFVKGTDEKYIEQICDYNENAEHDDCPDSLSSIIRVFSKKQANSDYKPIWMG